MRAICLSTILFFYLSLHTFFFCHYAANENTSREIINLAIDLSNHLFCNDKLKTSLFNTI